MTLTKEIKKLPRGKHLKIKAGTVKTGKKKLSEEEGQEVLRLLSTIHDAELQLVALSEEAKAQRDRTKDAMAELEELRAKVEFGDGPLFEKPEAPGG